MKLALVHDWLTGMRGGEKALEVICERFPDAELFTLVHVRGSVSPAIERLRPHTSFVQHLPFVSRLYRQYLPLFPAAIEQFDFDRFDLVVSTSHCCAKSIVRPGRARHLCYCLTPMRYAWDQFDAYFGPERIGGPASRLMRPVMAALARWDRDTAARADRYVAISHHVAGRIRRYYNREATVVYPPVDTDFFTPSAEAVADGHAPYALVVSALVPYKRIDLAIDGCRLAGVPLKIAGERPRTRAARAAGERRRRVSRAALRRGDPRTVPRRLGRAAARRRGFRDRAARGAGLRAAGRGARPRRRARDDRAGRHGRSRRTSRRPTPSGSPSRTCSAGGSMPAAIRRHAERFSRTRFGDEMEALVRGREVAADKRGRESTLEAERRARPARGGGPHAYGQTLQPAARRHLHRLRRPARAVGVRRRVRPAVLFRPDSDHQGDPAAQPVRQRPAVHRDPRAGGVSPAGALPAAARAARASTTSSPSSSAASSPSSSASSPRLYVQTYFATNAMKDRGVFEVSQVVWGIFLVLNTALTFSSRELVREVLERTVARRDRPEAHSHRRRRRARPPGRRQDPRAPGARLPDRRLRRRSRVGRSPRLPRAAAARHARRGARDRRPRGDRPPVRRAAARAARQDARAHRGDGPRVRGRQGRARPAAGHRAPRPARGSRRRPGHQHQRRPAAGLQQRREARDRHRHLERQPRRLRDSVRHDRPARPDELARRDLLPPGADGARRQAVHDRQIPIDVRRTRRGRPGRCGRARTTRA